MSKTAFEKYENARSTQLQSNEARKMRALIQQARASIQRSGSRWPFELAQNAHDPGPRSEGGKINLSLRHENQEVVFSHDGKPFSTSDLAALLSGGSSKEFDSGETTGRFGTGFLLTHVLSCEIAIEGILDLEGTYEKFSIELNRSGTEEEIFSNTTQCSTAIEKAEVLPLIEGHETAKFTYRLDSQEAAKQGMEAFVETLPYLYATCPHLGIVNIVSADGCFHFYPLELTTRHFGDNVLVQWQEVTIEQVGSDSRTIRSVIFRRSLDAQSGLVTLLERIGESWTVVDIPPDFPRIFVRFPIRSSEFLPVNVVVDGRFGLFQERDSVLMEDHDRAQIDEALNLLPDLLKASLEEDWKDGFTLARVGMPEQQFGDKLSESDEEWWRSTLASVATQLACMPIVRTEDGALHKILNEDSCADFVSLRLNSNDPLDEDCLNFNEVWQSASETVRALPPILAIAPQWTMITSEWGELGVLSQQLALSDIAGLARGTAGKLGNLQTKPPQLEWLARFLNLVGKLAATHNCTPILKDLLPSQIEVLKSPSALWRDAGIDERLKDISDSIGLGVRSRLLMKDLVEMTQDPALVDAQSLLDAEIPNSLTNEAILDECIKELSKRLPEGKEISPDDLIYREASIDILRFLWDRWGKGASDLARLCPLISSTGTSIRYSSRRMMAPVSHWHLAAREFSKVYKADRVLAEDYMTAIPGCSELVNALCVWEMVYPDPLFVEDIKELRYEKLKSLTKGETDPDAVVSNLRASRIAFLNSELIQRCSLDPELAKSLLGLVVCHVARHDDLWNHPLPVIGRRNEVEFPMTIRPAVWIADLKARAWVPVRGEKGLAPVIADAGNLVQLLEPRWLENNEPGIRLLCEFFGFKDLELQLLAKAPTEELRAEMENGLARIVQTLGSDAAAYGELATVVEANKKRADEKERNKKFGLAVQEAIRRCLSARQLDLVLIDSGYDYDVFLDIGDSVDAGTHHLKVADYLLEVKATTTGDVRLTPAQARTAAEYKSKFILCVVDLRGIDPTQMAEDWTEADVEPRTKIFGGVGDLTQHPSEIVEEAKGCPVGIRNDGALRYSVPVRIWDKGIPISSWVESLR